MAYARANLSGPLNLGADQALYRYTTTSETIAAVVAAGYFTNSTDNLRFKVGDLMDVKGSNNTIVRTECVTVSTTGAGVTFYVLPGQSVPVETTTGGALGVYGTSFLNSTAAFTLHTAPTRAGHTKKIVSLSGFATITTTGGAVVLSQTTNSTISLTGVGASVELTASSATNWVITAAGLVSVGGGATGEAMVRTS